MSEEYNLYCTFDIDKHKKTFINYLEVVILADGTIEYAIPSHQEKAIRLACKKLNCDRDYFIDVVSKDHISDWYEWLMDTAGVIMVWDFQVHSHTVTQAQIDSLKRLKEAELYFGSIPRKAVKYESNIQN